MKLLQRRGGAGSSRALVAAAVASGLVVGSGTPAPADQNVIVSPHPDKKQPRILDGRVYSITSSGPNVVVGGTFTRVRVGNSSQDPWTQPKLFRFNSNTGAIDTSFAPVLNGDVEAATYTADGQSILIAGDFTTVNGQKAVRIAKLHLNGTLDTSFTAIAGSRVKDFALVGNRLILGGMFGKINNVSVRGLAAVNATTGALDTSFNLPISESRDQYSPYVQELDVSRNGKWLVIGGNFKRVGTEARHQVAVIDLAGASPTVAPWATDRYVNQCASVFNDTYIRGIDISPDGTYFVVSTTGAYIAYDTMCDSAARWELPPTKTGSGIQPTWVNHTGGDTYWANEITESVVYVGGHQRWSNNPRPSPGGDNDGPGAVVRAGIVALDPYSGVPLVVEPGPRPGPRRRGALRDQRVPDGRPRHDPLRRTAPPAAGAAPDLGRHRQPGPQNIQLPVKFFYTTSGDSLTAMTFDGTNFGSRTTVSSPSVGGINWSGNRDGFVQHDKLNYFGPSQAFYSRSFNGTTIGTTVTNLSTSVGYVDTNYNLTPYDQPYGVAETRSAAFKGGRIFYTKTNSSSLYYRGHSLESGIIGGFESVASTNDWSGARALEFVGDYLYAAWSDNRLYRFSAPNGVPDWNSRTVINSGSSSGIPWSSMTGLWATK